MDARAAQELEVLAGRDHALTRAIVAVEIEPVRSERDEVAEVAGRRRDRQPARRAHVAPLGGPATRRLIAERAQRPAEHRLEPRPQRGPAQAFDHHALLAEDRADPIADHERPLGRPRREVRRHDVAESQRDVGDREGAGGQAEPDDAERRHVPVR